MFFFFFIKRLLYYLFFFFSSRRRHTRSLRDWSSDVCSSDLGYSTATLWLMDGFATASNEGWQAPGYWREIDGAWHVMTLGGLKPIDPSAPVSHVSYYEADAFARWAGRHLPTELEWEVAARSNHLND